MKNLLAIFFFLGWASTLVNAQNQDVSIAAGKFLSLLDAPLQKKANYLFNDDERFNWHFIPRKRKGVAFSDLNEAQKKAALNLLKLCLSDQGYQKATAIFNLENILKEIENRGIDDFYRDPLNYYFTIFGNPTKDKIWGWRIEGHHLSINFSSQNNEIVSSTPTFWGSNPGTIPSGPDQGKQVLKLETELGFLLVNSLTADQLKKALIAETAPAEIMTGNNRKAILLDPKGIAYSSLNASQQKILLQLLDAYVKNYAFGFSKKLMAKIMNAGIDNLYFAWAGSLKPGIGYYYRIQGPMLLIELDNTQNNANHVHSAIRDLNDDFAEDILKEHYNKEH